MESDTRPKPWDLFLVFSVHYDSWFEFCPLRYDNGLVYEWAVRKDNLLDLKEVRKLLKERTGSHIVYEMFFRIPQCELEVGLKMVTTEQDLEAMYEYAHRYGLIHVYITHGPQDELALYVDENCYYGSEDEIISRKKRVFKDAGNMSYEELVSWAEEEAETTSLVARDKPLSGTGERTVDKGKGIVNHGKGTVDKGKGTMGYTGSYVRKSPRKRNVGVVISDNTNHRTVAGDSSHSERDLEQRYDVSDDVHPMYVDVSETESDESEKSVDYLSECEEELISLRKRNVEAKKNPKKTPSNLNQESGGPSRPIRDFDDGDSNIVMEHEDFMESLMQQLRRQGDAMIDPFTLVDNKEACDKYPIHDEQTHWKIRKPKVGEKYSDAAQLKKCLTYYSLANGFSLWFYRSSKTKLIARCGLRAEKLKDTTKGKQRKNNKYPSVNRHEGSNCPFRCYGKLMVTESSFQVVSLIEEHTCVRNFKYGNLVNYKWIASHFGYKIRQNPQMKLHEIADLVLKKYKCIVSPTQCRNAKNKALNEGEHTIQEHYAMIRSYGKAILDSNDGSTVKLGVTVNPDNKTYFDRFYCCFHALKKGFILGCRPVIALDGCFLKKPNVGEILTAIGRDGNNHIFLIAWAVVNVENKDNWSWFLELLGEDIGMPTGNGLTLMSDQHKGLIEAVKEVMPMAEHRQCARHIYEGFRKHYSGVEFRELFWGASKATYPQLFNKIMQKIKRANPGAYDYLIKKDPKTWSRAFFALGSNCEAVENRVSECFNSVLLLVRNKPLITMLESMRVLVMERLNIMRQIHDKWSGDICPNIQKRLELNKDKHRFWHVIPAGGDLNEVRNGSDAFRVDEKNNTCSCRMWQLSGLPCPHSIAVIFKINKSPEDYVPDCFRKETYVKVYNQCMTPVGGMTFWPDSSMYSTVLAPKPRTMPGRPRKQRIRAAHERKYTNRVSRAGAEMTCHNCYEKGHNKSSCKKPVVIPPTKMPRGRGRPRKTQNTVGTSGGDSLLNGVDGGPVDMEPAHRVPETTNVAPFRSNPDNSVTEAIIMQPESVNQVTNSMDFVTIRVEGTGPDVPTIGLNATGRGSGLVTVRGRGRGKQVEVKKIGIPSSRGRGRQTNVVYGDRMVTSEGMPSDMARGRGRGRGRGTTSDTGLGVRKFTSDGKPVSKVSNVIRGRGRGTTRGRGGRTVVEKYGKLAKWFGIDDETRNAAVETLPLTQASQVGTSGNVRPRSARILEKRLSQAMDASGSSSANVQGFL